MAAGATYTPIATTTLGSAAASYTFSSIASTYTDLVLIFNGGGADGVDNLTMQFNGDTATNYSSTYLEGNGTTASSSRHSTSTYIRMCNNIAVGNGITSTAIINIPNYTSTSVYKTTLSRFGNMIGSYQGITASVGLWRATPAAITSIKIFTTGGNLVAGTTMSLYGIAAA